MKIAFFEIEQWEKDYIKIYANEYLRGAELFFYEGKLNKDNLPPDRDFDAISVFVGSNVDKTVIGTFSNIKLITTRSTGFDHIDLKTSKENNISVAYVPGYGDNTVAEFAFGLILNLSRKICKASDKVREEGNFSIDGLKGFDLKGRIIGIVGTGRIGKHMVKIAKGFDMKVIAFDPYPDENFAKEMDFKYMPLDDLLQNSDIISLHVPYSPQTYHLINSQNIKKIKKGAMLINTSRGAVVETEALLKGLNEGLLWGAGLDVLEEEGIVFDEKSLILYGRPENHNLRTVIENHILIDMPNVVITPHNAFNSEEALRRILDTDLQNIKSFSETGNPTHKIGA